MTGKRIYKSTFSIVLITILLFLTMFKSFGEESDLVTIEVSDTTVQMGSSLTLTLSMDSSIDAQEIGVEGLENFDIESTSQASSSSNINGVESSFYQYTLTLAPKAVGEFDLKAVVNDGKNVYESRIIGMSITQRDDSLDSENEDVFIKTVISGSDYYFGENIVLVYELYSRYNLDDFGFLDTLQYDEFIVESIPKEELESNVVTISGEKYLKQVVKKDILVPTRSGQFEIPSYRFQANLSTGDFFSRSEPRYLDTEAISFSVKELPTVNKPVNFTGIIGNLDVKSSLDKTEVSYGDAITLKVLLTGTGQLDSIGTLYKDKQKGFTIYETEKFTEKNLIDLDYVQSKEYEIIIVPEEIGHLSLEPIELWYFDTAVNDYQMIEIPEQNIVVTGVKVLDNSAIDESIKTESILISQVNYQDDQDDLITIQLDKRIVLTLLLVMVVLMILFGVYKKVESKPTNSKKEYLKIIDAATTINLLESIVERIITEKTGLNLKSQHRKNLMNHFNTTEEKILIESIIVDIEKDKINKKQDIDVIKEKLKKFVNLG